jgi:hypothetical protein
MPASGISDTSEFDALNTVGPEVTEILSQLTPCGKHTRAIEKSQHDRPDRSLAQNARDTTIGDIDLVFGSNGFTQHGEIDTFDLGSFVGSHEQLRRVATGPQVRGQHGHDLGEGIASGFSQRLVGPLCYPSRAQEQRLDLIIGQHERRKQETGFENIPDPGLSLDASPLPAERPDIPVYGSDRDPQFDREIRARYRPTMPPKDMQ